MTDSYLPPTLQEMARGGGMGEKKGPVFARPSKLDNTQGLDEIEKFAAWTYQRKRPNIDRFEVELKKFIQQEIAKARIDELTGVLTANNQPKFVPLNLKPRGMMEIRDRITELSSTLKEHKEK